MHFFLYPKGKLLHKRYFLTLLLPIFYFLNCPVLAASFSLNPDLTTYQMENGLEVIISPQSHGELVSVNLFVKAGSMTEGPYLGSGISHLLEHICFKGTEGRATTGLARDVRKNGGTINAYTSFDHTCYYVTFPANKINDALEIIADLVLHPKFNTPDFEKERSVVEKEMDMAEDNPDKVLSKHFWATAYRECPVRVPVIGFRELLQRLTPEDILAYYDAFYDPSNMVLVITGNCSADALKIEISKHFQVPRRQFVRQPEIWHEPKPLGPVYKEFRMNPLPHPKGIISWQTVSLDHPDMPALDVLAVLLGGMNSSPIRENLVQKGVLLSGRTWSYTPEFPGIFEIAFDWQTGTPKEIIASIQEQVQTLQKGSLDPEMLDVAKKRMKTQLFQGLETVLEEARILGQNFLSSRNPRYSEIWLKQIELVEPGDIIRVAKKYLQPIRQTAVILLPEAVDIPKDITYRPQSVVNPIMKTHASGLRLAMLPDRRLPLLYMNWAHPGGSLVETKSEYGLSAFFEELYGRKTESMSESERNALLDRLGGDFSSFSGRNTFGMSGYLLSDHLNEWLRSFVDICQKPVFDEEDIQTARQRIEARIDKAFKTPIPRAALELRNLLYGKDHPYGRIIEGNLDTLATFTQKMIQEFFRNHFNWSHSVLSVTGNFDPDEFLIELDQVLPEMDSETPFDKPIPQRDFQPFQKMVHLDSKQSVLMLGYPTVALDHPDRIVLELLDYYLSGQASPLFERIREEQGLSYSVGSQSVCGWIAGHFLIYVSFGDSDWQFVLQLVDKVLEDLSSKTLSEDLFEEIKTGFLGQDTRSREKPGPLGQQMALDTLYEMPFDYFLKRKGMIQKLKAEQLNLVVKRYIAAKPRALVVVGNTPDESNET